MVGIRSRPEGQRARRQSAGSGLLLLLADTLAEVSNPWSWYSDREVWELEQERIFARSWQYVGHAGMVEQPGDFFTARAGRIPIVAAQAEDGETHAFVNVCRHRGSTVAEGSVNRKTLQCPYHAWTDALGGRLRAAPRSSTCHPTGTGWRSGACTPRRSARRATAACAASSTSCGRTRGSASSRVNRISRSVRSCRQPRSARTASSTISSAPRSAMSGLPTCSSSTTRSAARTRRSSSACRRACHRAYWRKGACSARRSSSWRISRVSCAQRCRCDEEWRCDVQNRDAERLRRNRDLGRRD